MGAQPSAASHIGTAGESVRALWTAAFCGGRSFLGPLAINPPRAASGPLLRRGGGRDPVLGPGQATKPGCGPCSSLGQSSASEKRSSAVACRISHLGAELTTTVLDAGRRGEGGTVGLRQRRAQLVAGGVGTNVCVRPIGAATERLRCQASDAAAAAGRPARASRSSRTSAATATECVVDALCWHRGHGLAS